MREIWSEIKIIPTVFIPVIAGVIPAIKYDAPMLAMVIGFPLVWLFLLVFWWKEIG